VALVDNPTLDQLALQKAQDLAANYNSSYDHNSPHHSPTLGWPYDMEIRAGFRAPLMGAENWAMNSSAQRAFLAFMNSPTHRANIMNPGFRQTGIAVVPNIANGQVVGVVVEELFAG
ncbi:MAG TPA: CAP domain-containing protein, partial [Limnochordia bacterium]|nr:CAP domain-containing protein [Limnochordia bacterium]